jgi:PIN domain nuclease of toxin-antitoxin system
MNYLLDTHSFLWWDSAPQKLSANSRTICDDPRNRLFLSDVSIWEILIKVALGKMKLRLPLKGIVEEQQQFNGLQILPVKLEHLFALSDLPNHHRDPFDRLLIAQAQIEQFPILSVDTVFSLYPIQVIG